MAGFYADVPGHRSPYDRNGAIPFRTVGGAATAYTAADCRLLNSEADANGGATEPAGVGANEFVGVLFPSAQTFDGYYFAGRPNAFNTLEVFGFSYSNDTTTGADGTWTAISPDIIYTAYGFGGAIPVNPLYRTDIHSLSGFSAKAVRVQGRGNFFSAAGYSGWTVARWHLYCTPTGPTDRLALWNPITDMLVGGAYFDWGDVPVPSTATRTFRVKNLSSTKTATAVTVGMEALTDGSPSVVGMHTFSTDGGATYGPTALLGDITPSTISPVITIRRSMPIGAPSSLWAQRIVAAATTFV